MTLRDKRQEEFAQEYVDSKEKWYTLLMSKIWKKLEPLFL